MSRIDDALRRANQHKRTAGAVAYEELDSQDGRERVSPLVQYVSEGLPEEWRGKAATVMAFPPVLEEVIAPPVNRTEAAPLAGELDTATLDDTLIVSDGANPIGVEQYRKVAAELHQLQTSRGTKVVMVTSAMAGEGKTLTSANIALTLSEAFRRRVLLIDADLRRPSLHHLFKLPAAPGLAESLGSEGDAPLPVIEVSDRLSVLPAGTPELHPLAGLSSSRLSRLLADAAGQFDWVVIDTPPIALLPDANLLAEIVDAVIFVIAAGATKFTLVQRALSAINRDRLVGVVLNRAEPAATSEDYYRYYQTSGGGSARRSGGQ